MIQEKASSMTEKQMKDLKNKGMISLRNDEKHQNSTFIITGLERSGTTMIAKAIHKLGINVGESLNFDGVYEDKYCREYLEESKFSKFRNVVAERNLKYNVWGWKRPAAFSYHHKFSNIVRNPKFIVPFRDSVSIASRNSISVGNNFLNAVETSAKQNLLLCDFVRSNPYATLVLSYEKCLFNKEEFICSLINFLHIHPSKTQIEAAIESIKNGDKGYLKYATKKELRY